MAEDVKVTLSIKAIDKISKDVKKISKGVEKLDKTSAVKNLTRGFSNLGAKIVVLNQGLQLAGAIYRRVAGSIREATTLAAEQQRQELLLADALKQKGKFTEELFESTKQYASSLQQLTTFGDEQILQAQKILIQLGVETSQLNEVTKATLDLAAAKNLSLASAADLVSKSIGSTTNALSRYGVQISSAKDATTRASEIVAGISRLFGGAATAETLTFAGAQKQLSNTFGDTLEKLGDFIIQNPFVISGFKAMNNALVSVQKVLVDNKKTINAFVADIVNFAKVIIDNFKKIIRVITIFAATFITISRLPLILKTLSISMKTLAINMKGANISLKGLGIGLKGLIVSLKLARIAAEALKASVTLGISIALTLLIEKALEAKDAVGSWGKVFSNAGKTIKINLAKIERAVLKFKLSIVNTLTSIPFLTDDKIFKAVADNTIKNLAAVEDKIKGLTDTAKELQKTLEETGNITIDSQIIPPTARAPAAIAPAGEAAVPVTLEQTDKAAEPIVVVVEKTFKQSMVDSAKAFTAGIAKGTEGAATAVTAIAGLAATAILGPMGAAVTPLLDMLLMGPDKIREMVTGFMNALPDIILALVEGAITFIEVLIEKIPDLIGKLVAMLPTLIEKLAQLFLDPKFYFKLAEGLIKAVFKIAGNIGKIVGKAIAAVVTSILGLEEDVTTSRQTIESQAGGYKKRIEASEGITEQEKEKISADIDERLKQYNLQVKAGNVEGQKAAKSALGELYDAIAATYGISFARLGERVKGSPRYRQKGTAATGLDVPNLAQYKNDRYGPVNLDAGEAVITGKTTDKLKAFLDKQGTAQPQNITINLQVGEQQLADVILNLNQRGFRTT